MCILCFVILGLLSLRWGNILKWPIEGFLGERHECQATIRLNVEVNYPLDRLEAHERLFFSSDLHILLFLSATPTLKKIQFQENGWSCSLNVLVISQKGKTRSYNSFVFINSELSNHVLRFDLFLIRITYRRLNPQPFRAFKIEIIDNFLWIRKRLDEKRHLFIWQWQMRRLKITWKHTKGQHPCQNLYQIFMLVLEGMAPVNCWLRAETQFKNADVAQGWLMKQPGLTSS